MRKHILILEDEVGFHKSLKHMVSRAGYNPLLGINGLEGLDLLSQHRNIHCIILDYQMPEMNGLEFLAEKQKVPVYQTIPVLMHTSCSRHDPMFHRPVANGWISGFLNKPFWFDELVEKLQAISEYPTPPQN